MPMSKGFFISPKWWTSSQYTDHWLRKEACCSWCYPLLLKRIVDITNKEKGTTYMDDQIYPTVSKKFVIKNELSIKKNFQLNFFFYFFFFSFLFLCHSFLLLSFHPSPSFSSDQANCKPQPCSTASQGSITFLSLFL